MMNQQAIVDVIVRVIVFRSDAPFQSSLNDFAVSHVNPKENYYYQQRYLNFAHQCYSVSIDSNEAFEFIFKNDYPDLFNFEPGVLHFQPSMALLHLSNQFMYHMTISGNC